MTVDIEGFEGRFRRTISIPKGERLEMRVPVRSDSRRIRVAPPQPWDRQLLRILKRSTLDGQPGIDWIRNESVRARRQACVLNCLAVCAESGLSPRLDSIYFVEVDRVYAKVRPTFSPAVRRLFRLGFRPRSDIHERLLDSLPARERKGYRLLSFRQRRSPSLQVVLSLPERSVQSVQFLAELDIDRGSIRHPLGLLIHLGEVVHPARTDHLKLRRKLTRTRARRFLAYSLR